MRRWNASAGAVATKILIAINAAVFVVTSVPGVGGPTTQDLAVAGPFVAGGQYYRLITAGFIHYGLLHIGFNMLILWRLGGMVEPALGRTRFVALYFASLLAGSCGALILSPNAFTGGASGAVFGLAGAAAVGMRQRGINVWQSGIGPMIAINLVITFAVPGISVGGHLGGLVGGAAVGAYMLRQPTNRRSVAEGIGVALAVSAVAVALALAAANHALG